MTEKMLKLGIIGYSFKDSEKRLPIHPRDFRKISEKYQKLIYIDHGYGMNFGYADDQLRPYVGGIINRNDIYKICDIVLVLKYTNNDYENIDPNKICWGWHHLVQNKKNVDIILEKKLTIISIEQMFDNDKYILEDNRLIAGYSSVMHALQLKGLTGYLIDSNDQPKIAVISYGCVGKGVVSGLTSMNMHNIDVFTQRHPDIVTDKKYGVNYYKYPEQDKWSETLKKYDVIVNCVLQNPLDPITFLKKEDILNLEKQMFIIDISCDVGMGFDFAVQTSFKQPIIKITDNVDFYGIDHTPSIYYDTITRKISEKLLQYIECMIDNKFTNNNTLQKAIEVDNGKIINQTIVQFQNR